jgi:hypothetical protein
LLGLNILANPSMLLLLPALPLWLGWRSRRELARSALAAAAALLLVAPATLHNFLASRDAPGGPELILVSAQSGVTLAHGNGPGALGVYRPLPGVSQDRAKQNAEAYRQARTATGREGWKNTDRHFRDQALAWIFSHPGESAPLVLRKAGLLIAGQDYGDLYNITLEQSDPELPDPVPLPLGLLQTGWLLPAAFAGAWFLLRACGRVAAPDLALLALPCLIVLVFWYSPRYRMPLIPSACLLAPFAVARLLAIPRAAPRCAALAVLLLLPLAGRQLLLHTRLDDASRYRGEYEFHIGYRLRELGRPGEALPRFERALTADFSPADSHEQIGRSRVDLGQQRAAAGDSAAATQLFTAALGDFRACLDLDPQQMDVWVSRGALLAKLGDPQQGRSHLAEALRLAEAAGLTDAASQIRRMLAQL